MADKLYQLPDKVVEGLLEKLPDLEQYQKNPKQATNYIFTLLFIALFAYIIWGNRGDCSEKVAVVERALEREIKNGQRRDSIYSNRISALETALMIKNGTIKEIGTKVGVNPEDMNNPTPQTTGGSQ